MSKSSKSARDNRANQLNPFHPAYHLSRGASPDEAQLFAELRRRALDNDTQGESTDASPETLRASSNASSVKPE